jgi:hypothetical protein
MCSYNGDKIARIARSLHSGGSKYAMLSGVIEHRTVKAYHTLRHLLYILLSHLFSHRLFHSLLTRPLLTRPLLIQQMGQFQLMIGVILSSSKQLCSKRRWRHAVAAMNTGFRWI